MQLSSRASAGHSFTEPACELDVFADLVDTGALMLLPVMSFLIHLPHARGNNTETVAEQLLPQQERV